MKELSKFKVLSITLLVTMSSCVAGTMDINAETLRSYGIEIDLTALDKVQTVQRYKKSRPQNNNKFRFTRLVESGRKHIVYKGLTIDYIPVTVHLCSAYFTEPMLNQRVQCSQNIYKTLYTGVNFFNRAGPCCLPNIA